MPGDLDLGCHSCHSTPRNDVRRRFFALGNHLKEGVVHAGRRVLGRVRRVHGPARVEYGPDELVTLCIARDARPWIRTFLEHHLTLGSRHVFLLDNGSSDDTVDLASAYDRVTVFRSDLHFGRYEVAMRRWLTRTVAQGRWSLYCDVDELFDYPASDRLTLRDLLRYLNHHGYRAVTAQMLDLFSDRPFSTLHGAAGERLRETYRFYDLADLVPTHDVYWIRNGDLENRAIACHFGGIRKRFFGDDCLLLTKHALVHASAGVRLYPYDGHFMTGARVADVSTVLLHYKYVHSLAERARQSMHRVNAELYRGLARELSRNPDLCLRRESARELQHVDELVDRGFLVVTDQYRAWVERHGR